MATPVNPARIYEVIDLICALDKQQSAYGTKLEDAVLLHRVLCRGTSFPEVTKAYVSDAQLTGRERLTTRRLVGQSVRYSATFELSSQVGVWLCGLALGKTDTDGQAAPYTHVLTFPDLSDPATSKQLPATTVYSALQGDNAALQRRFQDLVVESVSIQGRNKETPTITVNFVGSGMVTALALAVVPEPTIVSPLESGFEFLLGAVGDTDDLTDRVIDWQISLSRSLDQGNMRHPGSGLYASRAWGMLGVAGWSITLFADNASTDLFDNWDADTDLEVSLKAIGGMVGETQTPHSLAALFPVSRPNCAPTEVDGKLAWRLDAGLGEVLGATIGEGTIVEPVQVTVVTDLATVLVAPGA